MIQYLNWVRKGSTAIPKFLSSSVKPINALKIHDVDLIRMHDLRRYHLDIHPRSSKHPQYIRDLEILHGQLNQRMGNKTLFKWGAAFLLSLVMLSSFIEFGEEKIDWASGRSQIHERSVFSELDEGGEEGED